MLGKILGGIVGEKIAECPSAGELNVAVGIFFLRFGQLCDDRSALLIRDSFAHGDNASAELLVNLIDVFQESFRVTVLLKTSFPDVLSGSTQKYPTRSN